MRMVDGEALALFSVPGMSVAGRSQELRQAIGKLDGVLQLEVNYILDTVSIKYDAGKLTLDRIREEIER
jgi:copper chaperone CopZ